MHWKRLLSYITGSVDEELLLRNEYLVRENRILRSKIKGRPRLSDKERISLAELGKKLGRKALFEIASVVSPDTILRWQRKLVAKKFDGSRYRKYPGWPPITKEARNTVLRLARENRSWGYDRIAGVMKDLGYKISDTSVGTILKKHGLEPAPERRSRTSWREFVRAHQDVLSACDFFTVEAWSPRGLVTWYVLFFIHVGSRAVHIAGITTSPTEGWMKQIARNLSMTGWGFLEGVRYLIHDRDSKFTDSFREILRPAGIKCLRLPPKSPNLNAYAERFVRSIKEECLSKLILFGEGTVRKAISEYVEHYHRERNHQGLGNRVLQPDPHDGLGSRVGRIRRRERLGGLLNCYRRRAG